MDIVERLRAASADEALDIGEAWNLLDEAADFIADMCVDGVSEIESLRDQLAERRRRMEVIYGWLKSQGQLRDDCPGPKFFLTYPEARDWFNEDGEAL